MEKLQRILDTMGSTEALAALTSKPKADYQNDDYYALDLPVAPAAMVGGKSWFKAPTFHRTRWRRLFSRHL